MTDSVISTVLDAYANAWARGDLGTIMASYHDDFELTYFGSNPLAGHHVGKAAALAAMGEFSRRTARQFVGIQSVMAGADRGAIIARERFGTGDGVMEVDRVLVYTVADGKLRKCWVYDGDQAAIDRLVGPA